MKTKENPVADVSCQLWQWPRHDPLHWEPKCQWTRPKYSPNAVEALLYNPEAVLSQAHFSSCWIVGSSMISSLASAMWKTLEREKKKHLREKRKKEWLLNITTDRVNITKWEPKEEPLFSCHKFEKAWLQSITINASYPLILHSVNNH